MKDSWLYSNANTSIVPCKVTGGHVVISTDCNRAEVQAAPSGNCQGCMDSNVIMNAVYSGLARGSVASDLATRYNPCGNGFNTYMGNIWDNYYFVKFPAIPNIYSRTNTAITQLNTVAGYLTAIGNLFSGVVNSLNAAVGTVTDPNYGMIAGLNCLLIGQDISTFVSTICVSNFNTVYLTRLIMGISSFGILFALCCIVCSGVRHFKHSERKDKIAPSFGGKNSF